MTLPSSGVMTLAMIQAEFGGANPISLSEYYAGGAYVPAGASGINGPIPSSGPISLRHFYGATKFIETQTVTGGSRNFDTTVSEGFLYGYMGTVVDGTFAPLGNAVIFAVQTMKVGAAPRELSFDVVGTFANSGWTSLTVSGHTYMRSAARFEQIAISGQTAWTWTIGSEVLFPIGVPVVVNFA